MIKRERKEVKRKNPKDRSVRTPRENGQQTQKEQKSSHKKAPLLFPRDFHSYKK